MCRRYIYLVSSVFVLGLTLTSVGEEPDPHLAGWWRLDGDTLDSSGKGRDGTIVGAPQFVGGHYDQALQLDGIDDYVEITGWTGIVGANPVTGTAWVNTTSTGTNNAGGAGSTNSIVEWGPNTSGQRFGWRINGGRLRFEHHGGNRQGDTNLADGEWHHVAVTIIENATISYPDVILWLDGEDDTRPGVDTTPFNLTPSTVRIGSRTASNDRFFTGILDDVRIYERTLTPNQIKDLFNGLALFRKAYDPDPPDGAEYGGPFVLLSWTAGLNATQHDVYFGDSFANVDAGTPDTARGRQTETFHYVPTIFPGTTYYWRIDEVEADGTTIRRGDIWSLVVPPLIAYDPSPADALKFVDPNVTLSWTAGYGAIVHDVYFGEDFEDVNAGTADTAKGRQPDATYTAGPLAADTVYYWRVDEVEIDMTTVHKGDVWSFTTMPIIPITDPNLVGWWKLDEGQGPIAVDWSGHGNHGTLVVDPQWVAGYDGDGLSFDGAGDTVNFGTGPSLSGTTDFTVAAWIRTSMTANGVIIQQRNGGFNGEYRFMVTTSGTLNLMVYGDDDYQYGFSTTRMVNDGRWHHAVAMRSGGSGYIYVDGGLAAWDSGTLRNLDGTIQTAVGADVRDNVSYFNGTIDDIRVYSKALTPEEVKQAMRGDPLLAWDPSPGSAVIVDVDEVKPLTWSAGDNAAEHDVYLGTDETAVEDADTSTTGIYRGRIDPNSYTPPESVEFSETYYWRIDEYNTDASISRGRVWSFTVAEYLVVDDFESYDDYCSRVFYTWPDGWGYSGDVACGVEPYGGNGTGSTVGYLKAPYAEQTIIHGGDQSMPMEYLNDGSDGRALYSETDRTFDTAQDWTRYGVKALTVWFRGYPQSFSTFAEAPIGTSTMTARSGDIYAAADSFHYVFKQLSGTGSIVAKVENVTRTSASAKAGVMIRETLDPNSAHAFVFFRPDGGIRFNRRLVAGDTTDGFNPGGAFSAPVWVKLERAGGNTFRASYSTDGSTWEDLDLPVIVTMATDLYMGLALGGNNTGATCVARFSEVAITGTVTGAWQSQEIGIASNTSDQLYVALEDSTGMSKVVEHEDPDAALLDTWQEWNIDLKEFSDAGVDLASIKKMYIGMGDRVSPQSGGAGTLYVDDIRLYRPRCVASLAKPVSDFSDNCVVDYPDLEILTANWLISDYEVTPMAASDANLVAHYELNGNANDSSGSGYHGAERGGPTYVAGMIGQAINLDGLDDYVAIQDFNYASTGHTEVGVCAWIRTSSEIDQCIASFDRNEYWRLDINGENVGPGEVGWKVMSSTGQMDYGSDTRVDDGEWHHAAGTFDNGTLSLYVDGILEASALGGSTFGTGNTRYGFVGSRSEADVFDGSTGAPWTFDGDLDDVRIYRRALSQAEVASLAGKAAPFTQPLYLLLTPRDPAINMNVDNTIDLKDYALLVETWLDEILWP